MALQLLESRDGVQAALAMMNPAAREAALLLAHRLFENPALLDDGKAAFRECCQACAVSLLRLGVDVRANPDAFDAFLAESGCSVMNVGFSIVHVAVKEHERKQVWGAVGKVAAAAVGVALGAWVS